MQDVTSSIIQGFPIGCVFALVAMGFVLTYKVSGVFNLAFGAQAYAALAEEVLRKGVGATSERRGE